MRAPLTYAVPPGLVGRLQPGHVVRVPLHGGSETGYVVELLLQPDLPPAKIKPLQRLLDDEVVFDAAQLSFFRWIASYYLCSLGVVIHTAVPSQVRATTVRGLVVTDQGIDALAEGSVDEPRVSVLREIVGRPGLTKRGLSRRLREELQGPVIAKALTALLRRDLVGWVERDVGAVRPKVRVATRVGSYAEARKKVPRAGHRMLAVLAALEQGPVEVPHLVQKEGASASTAVKRLAAAGALTIEERPRVDALLSVPSSGASEPPPLNAHQQAALAALTADDADGAYLLFGVTGSGKTEVFLGAARSALDRGKQVLVLVPEIGLTPQLVGRFKARFGDDVAVLHSGLTGAERREQWRRIRAGRASVAVGARSALFAPFDRLGLIVVDEEHDDSYKQSEAPTYNARDLAVVLGHARGCAVVLASATPALESWANVKRGRYALLELPNRATPRPVPDVEVVDLTQVEVPEGAERPLLAPVVFQALNDTFARGGQAVVLYNRRGFATMVECTACGATYECPNCGITMTLHRRAWQVVCHYCAFKRSYSETCPVCKADALQELGKGTERIVEGLGELFPDVAIARLDADTTAPRGALQRILDAFRAGETQLLVGTQIVAKGHDFPGVHTAVVVSADRGFRMPDFRAAERTYALLVQLAGRAGRGEHPGRVFVQTWDSGHYVLRNLHDLRRFVDAEMRIRATMRYPPFSNLVLLRLEGADRRKVLGCADGLARSLSQTARGFDGMDVLGPAPAALPRLGGRWRFQIVLRGSLRPALRRYLREVIGTIEAASGRGVRVSWDVDPRQLM